MEVAEKVADGVLTRVRNDVVVDLCDGLDQPLIEEHVEGEDLPVQRLERIVVRVILGARSRIGRRGGASAQRQKWDERSQDFFYGICEVHGGSQVLSVYRGSLATLFGWVSFTT